MLALTTWALAHHFDCPILPLLGNFLNLEACLHPVLLCLCVLLLLAEDPLSLSLVDDLVAEASRNVPLNSLEAIVRTQILYIAEEDAVLEDLIVLG